MKPITVEKLQRLKLPTFVQVFKEIQSHQQDIELAEALDLMAERELLDRDNKRVSRLLKSAKLRYPAATIVDIDYSSTRQFNKSLVRELSHCQWLEQHKNIILDGPTGTGKSYLACALGRQACQIGYKTRYYRVTRLVETLRLSHADGSYSKLLEQWSKVDLLILDDWGIDQLDRQARRDLLEVMDDRCGRHSTIVTSQLPIEQWHQFIGDDTIADAVCDRIIHNAYLINITGDNMRKKTA